MTGRHKWSEIRARRVPNERAWRAAAAQDLREQMRLDELRHACRLSQQELARRLKSHQAQISRLEQRADLFVSTVRRYVEALGGELEIVATFPDGTVRIDNFRELAKGFGRTHETPASKRRQLTRKVAGRAPTNGRGSGTKSR
jgi:transcriptional regulator with XRE-family HTH domain